ncbi:hypothetical protein J6590_003593 [Homalodisca vitripennis]|nr:hypothetical protein J6590_003593 [Homalodisca vitripennis]
MQPIPYLKLSPTQRPPEPASNENSCSQTLYSHAEEFIPQTVIPCEPPSTQLLHRLSPFCGKNITIEPSGLIRRNKQQPNNGLVFTALPLGVDELLEVAVEQWVGQWAGSLAIGVTCMAPSDKAPPTILAIKDPTWYIMGNTGLETGGEFHVSEIGTTGVRLPPPRSVAVNRSLLSHPNYVVSDNELNQSESDDSFAVDEPQLEDEDDPL